jgi:NADPH:quinone reductase-like Zn-dependent oxidoreductase
MGLYVIILPNYNNSHNTLNDSWNGAEASVFGTEKQEKPMKVIIIGATGTIGTAVARSLAEHHQVVRVGHARGDFQVDLGSKVSIERLYGELAPVDAVVSVAGNASSWAR